MYGRDRFNRVAQRHKKTRSVLRMRMQGNPVWGPVWGPVWLPLGGQRTGGEIYTRAVTLSGKCRETLFGAPFGVPYGCLSVASGLEGRFTSS